MIYRIEYAEKCCDFANGRKELLDRIKRSKNETITDIRQVYKNGVSATVLDTYQDVIRRSRV